MEENSAVLVGVDSTGRPGRERGCFEDEAWSLAVLERRTDLCIFLEGGDVATAEAGEERDGGRGERKVTDEKLC